jgi:uncharacterized protein (TIGR00251 family)
MGMGNPYPTGQMLNARPGTAGARAIGGKMRDFKIRTAQSGAAITVKVTPNARRDEIAGVMADGTIKVSLKAKPVEGAANEALVGFLAERLRVSKSQIDIVAGHTGTKKLISIVGLAPAEVEARLVPPEPAAARRSPRK